MPTVTAARRPTLIVAFAAWAGVLVWSAISPVKPSVWVNEVSWAVAGLAVTLVAWRRFPLTTMSTVILTLWAAVLAYGGHYTYGNAPLGRWLEHFYAADRNPWDRVGHLMQGFAPAIVVREILWRRSPLREGRFLNPLVFCCCMALSACWELLEWAGSEATAHGNASFLGGQGDVWDTQWDMFSALIGALVGLLLLSRWHRRQLAALETSIASDQIRSGTATSERSTGSPAAQRPAAEDLS